MKTQLNILNKTYFHSSSTTDTNVISSPSSFSAYMSRRKDVFQRLYAEFKHTIELGGYSVFYTFTYSEHSITKFLGHNVHNYSHLRDFFVNSGFTKSLERNFNTKLKYCITSEFGEGKGKRGYHNNPHYHGVMNLTPINPNEPIISPTDFKNLAKSYWQGLNDDTKTLYTDRICPFNICENKDTMKYGFLQEGDNEGVIYSPSALMYVVKYVTKDSTTLSTEESIKSSIDFYFKYECLFDKDWLRDAIDNFICTIDENDFSEYGIHKNDWLAFGDDIIYSCSCAWDRFLLDYIPSCRSAMLKEYNRNYKPRFRASQGLGLSVFSSADFNKEDATINSVRCANGALIPTKEKITGQLYRHWFYRVEQHEVWSPTQGKMVVTNFYRPNGNLSRYKKEHLTERLNSSQSIFNTWLSEMTNKNNYILFAQLKNKSNICDVEMTTNELLTKYEYDYGEFTSKLARLIERFGRNELVSRLSIYHCIYRSRSYNYCFECEINPIDDYNYFVDAERYNSFKEIRYDLSNNITSINNKDLMHYENHPYFAEIMPLYYECVQYGDCSSWLRQKRFFEQDRNKRLARQLIQGLATRGE